MVQFLNQGKKRKGKEERDRESIKGNLPPLTIGRG